MDFSQSDNGSDMGLGPPKQHVEEEPQVLPPKGQRVAASGAVNVGNQNLSVKAADHKRPQCGFNVSGRVTKCSSNGIITRRGASQSPAQCTPRSAHIRAQGKLRQVRRTTQGAKMGGKKEGTGGNDCVVIMLDSDGEVCNSIEDRPAVDNHQSQGGQAHHPQVADSVLVNETAQDSDGEASSSSISLGHESGLPGSKEADDCQDGPTSRRLPHAEQQKSIKVPLAAPKVLGKRVRMHN